MATSWRQRQSHIQTPEAEQAKQRTEETGVMICLGRKTLWATLVSILPTKPDAFPRSSVSPRQPFFYRDQLMNGKLNMYITARRTATEGFIELSRHTPFYTIYEETFISHTDLSALLRQPPLPSAPNFGGRQKQAHCRPPGLPRVPTAPASGLLHSLAPAAALSSTSTAAKRCGRSAGASGVRSLRDVPRSSG